MILRKLIIIIIIIILIIIISIIIVIIVIIIAIKKGEHYAKTISWIRYRTSFAFSRSALVCLRGSRTRRVPCDNVFFIDLLIISYVFLLVRKMNSNRFISLLMDQKLILIIRISALTFLSSTGTFDLIFYYSL